MIQFLSTIITVWIYGIPVAGIVFGAVVAKAGPLHRRRLRRRHYAFWCVAWPWAVAVLAFQVVRAWWLK